MPGFASLAVMEFAMIMLTWYYSSVFVEKTEVFLIMFVLYDLWQVSFCFCSCKTSWKKLWHCCKSFHKLLNPLVNFEVNFRPSCRILLDIDPVICNVHLRCWCVHQLIWSNECVNCVSFWWWMHRVLWELIIDLEGRLEGPSVGDGSRSLCLYSMTHFTADIKCNKLHVNTWTNFCQNHEKIVYSKTDAWLTTHSCNLDKDHWVTSIIFSINKDIIKFVQGTWSTERNLQVKYSLKRCQKVKYLIWGCKHCNASSYPNSNKKAANQTSIYINPDWILTGGN
jgi:hypothetical protein